MAAEFLQLADELSRLLIKANELRAANQIDGLIIKSRCGCRDDFCAFDYSEDPRAICCKQDLVRTAAVWLIF